MSIIFIVDVLQFGILQEFLYVFDFNLNLLAADASVQYKW